MNNESEPDQPETTAPRIAPAFDQAGRPLHTAAGSPQLASTLSPAPEPQFNPAGSWYPPAPPKRQYQIDRDDAIMALVLVALGFLWWNWLWPRPMFVPIQSGALLGSYLPGLSVTIFFALAITCSLVYFGRRQVLVPRAGVVGAVLIMAGALPYALFDTTPVHILGGMALLAGYITWHAYLAGTAISRPLGGLVLADALNQGFVVPFTNLGAWFASLRGLFHRGQKTSQWLIGVVGVIIAVPVFAIVLMLLMSSDTNFSAWMAGLGGAFAHINAWRFIWQLSLGVLVAIYGFALLHGNARRSHTTAMTKKGLVHGAHEARKLSVVALATPMIILCVTYVVFLAAIGTSLVAAFRSPDGVAFAYADYARSGFFQLVVVAAINLLVLGIAWLFVRRGAGSAYSGVARVVGGVLSLLTLLLVATAISKMALYIQQSGLTRLRVYTMWFMVVMFIVFALVCVWHIKPFRAGRPVVLVVVGAMLVLMWANTDGLIASYNVDRYLSGATKKIDVDYLYQSLSVASVPALAHLRDNATDPAVSSAAANALNNLSTDQYSAARPWTSLNWQWARAEGLTGH